MSSNDAGFFTYEEEGRGYCVKHISFLQLWSLYYPRSTCKRFRIDDAVPAEQLTVLFDKFCKAVATYHAGAAKHVLEITNAAVMMDLLEETKREMEVLTEAMN